MLAWRCRHVSYPPPHRLQPIPATCCTNPPARIWTFAPTFGKARVFYPEEGEGRGTAAALPDVDPVGLVRSVLAGWVWTATDREITR